MCVVAECKPRPLCGSPQRGELVDEVIDGVDDQLDVVFLGHAMAAVFAQDNVDVAAEDALGHLHGHVPGHVGVLQAVDEPHGALHGDGALQYTVRPRLPQEVHAQSVRALVAVAAGESPEPTLFDLLPRLQEIRQHYTLITSRGYALWSWRDDRTTTVLMFSNRPQDSVCSQVSLYNEAPLMTDMPLNNITTFCWHHRPVPGFVAAQMENVKYVNDVNSILFLQSF